ncbi:hypothetical protein HS088_TW09G00541 [Tripterygium wilfordii]|uniref:Uncharacterized protein n=1 Tax=Tripterygium wilfordii TaxID=458696 RepID=A0A7J7D836_TRIWF|nr:hypothetical protein HS088_TW09G00541 [Tripterygium wilfordii]
MALPPYALPDDAEVGLTVRDLPFSQFARAQHKKHPMKTNGMPFALQSPSLALYQSYGVAHHRLSLGFCGSYSTSYSELDVVWEGLIKL